jgi:hypothetical protein
MSVENGMSWRRRAAVQALLWSAYGALHLVFASVYTRITSGLVLIAVLLSLSLWGATEALRAMALRGAWLEQPPAALLLRTLLWPPVFALGIQTLGFVVVASLLHVNAIQLDPAGPRQGWGTFFGYVLNTSFMLWLWLGIWSSWQYLRRWRQGEIDKWQAEAHAA